jgi:hypothetical protein
VVTLCSTTYRTFCVGRGQRLMVVRLNSCRQQAHRPPFQTALSLSLSLSHRSCGAHHYIASQSVLSKGLRARQCSASGGLATIPLCTKRKRCISTCVSMMLRTNQANINSQSKRVLKRTQYKQRAIHIHNTAPDVLPVAMLRRRMLLLPVLVRRTVLSS